MHKSKSNSNSSLNFSLYKVYNTDLPNSFDLIIKESTIPGANKGCFTTNFIPKGSKIKFCDKIAIVNDYAMFDVKPKFENTGCIFYCPILSDNDNYNKQYEDYVNISSSNANIEIIGNVNEQSKSIFFWCEALKDIQPGEELYRVYGKDWLVFIWGALKHSNEKKEYLKYIINVCIRGNSKAQQTRHKAWLGLYGLYLQMQPNFLDDFFEVIERL